MIDQREEALYMVAHHPHKAAKELCVLRLEVARLKNAASTLIDALEKEQYSRTPPEPWPGIAGHANALGKLIEEQSDE